MGCDGEEERKKGKCEVSVKFSETVKTKKGAGRNFFSLVESVGASVTVTTQMTEIGTAVPLTGPPGPRGLPTDAHLGSTVDFVFGAAEGLLGGQPDRQPMPIHAYGVPVVPYPRWLMTICHLKHTPYSGNCLLLICCITTIPAWS